MTETLAHVSSADAGVDVVSTAQQLVDVARRRVEGQPVEDQAVQKITLRPPNQPDTLVQIAVRKTDDCPDGQLWVRKVSGPTYTYVELPREADVTPRNIAHLTAATPEAQVAQKLNALTALVTHGEQVPNSSFILPRESYRRSPRQLLEAAETGVVQLFDRARSVAQRTQSRVRPAA